MKCPSNHWNDGSDVCSDCGEDLNHPQPTLFSIAAFNEFQARVRANARIHIEADLYWRTNRWAEDG